MKNNLIDDILDIEQRKYLNEKIEEQRKKGDVSVNISKEKYKVKTKNEFVILFYDALDYLLVKYKLTSLDIRVLLCLLRKSRYGNLLKYTQVSISKELNTKQPNISRTFKKLKKCNLIIETKDGDEYLDPQVLCKGNLGKSQKNENYKELKDKSLFDNF